MPKLTGQSLGRYQILEQLGEGGMATVYKAYDTRLETDVAVKVIRTETLPQNAVERALKRFEREAKALARLTHPNIVKVTDYGEFEGKPYLVMPYLPGGTLKQKLGKPIPWQEAAQLLIPIAEALDYAHSQNMIHRDVKPSNILLTQRGQPMLTDFGIAKVLDLEETQDLTGTSAAVGTPEYMAPEQATAKTVDRRADIYALGIIFYEMVTGRKPYIADTPMAVLIKQATEPLPRPKQYAPNLPDGVEKVLLNALAKKPEDRYQSMDDFAVALKRLPTGRSAVKRELDVQTKVASVQKRSARRDEIVLPPVSRRAVIVIGIIVIGVFVVSLLPMFFRSLPSSVVTITLSNNYCKAQDYYVDGKLAASISSGANASFVVTSGQHQTYICNAGTNTCGATTTFNWTAPRSLLIPGTTDCSNPKLASLTSVPSSMVTITLSNNYCKAQDYYVDGKLAASISSGANTSFVVTSGQHQTYICNAGTNTCGATTTFNWTAPQNLIIPSASNCR